MILSFIAALVGIGLTAAQIVLLTLQGKGICFNEGCEIVDSLTLVPPLYINIAGLLFFLLAGFGLSRAKSGSDLWRGFVSLLLIAGMAAEAVLVFFQHKVVEAYCSYCLIILGLVIVANLFMGLKQMFKGVVVFSAVFIALLSVNLSVDVGRKDNLAEGTLARLERTGASTDLYLFFSSTCPHCEVVIEALKQSEICTLNFNPVDSINEFTFPGSTVSALYQPEINKAFLKEINISEVPTLLSRQPGLISIIQGEGPILRFLEKNCAAPKAPSESVSITGQSDQSGFLPPEKEESCSIDADCEDPASTDSRANR